MFRLTLLASLLLSAPAAFAQESGNRLVFRLGGGVASVPSYFGSGETEVGPDFAFSLAYGRFAGFEFGDPDPYARASGLGFGASFRIVPERNSDDFFELKGMDVLDRTIELGGQVSYSGAFYEAFAALRYGIGGHESMVGEVGVDGVFRPTPDLTVSIGPRAVFGSSDYAAYYFGVTAAEASRSVFPEYEPDAGLMSAGIELGVDYRITPLWSAYATARYDQLQDSAADSPLTFEDDQVSLSLGVTRIFDIRF